MYDLAIMGGGPAGLTAAVYAARKKLNLILITGDIGGQVVQTVGVENYMGFQFVEGTDLIQKFEEQVKQFPIEMNVGTNVIAIRSISGGFEMETDAGGKYQAKAVIVATGKRPRMLNVPGEDALRGRGVTYCSICDGPVFAGETVAVVGGGNSALEATDDMLKIAEHVYLISITPFTGDMVLVDRVKNASNVTIFLEHEVVRIEGSKRVEGITIRDLKTKEEKRLDVGGIFVEIGLIPNSEFAKEIVTRNQAGEIQVNCANETNVTGLYAAGDVTTVPEKQIVVSAGEGAKAALRAHRYLQRL